MNTIIENKNARRPGESRSAFRRRTVHSKPVAKNIGIDTRDGMPVEVANSMLFGHGVKLTGAVKRAVMAARETVFTSTLEPKPFSENYKNRARKASAEQLVKWAKRTSEKRLKVTRDYMKLAAYKATLDPMKLHQIAKVNRTLGIMDVEAQRLDIFMAALRAEAEHRLVRNDIFNPVRDSK